MATRIRAMATMTMNTSSRLGAIATLVGLTSILPEMLSGNTPAPALFRPDVFVFFCFAYGLPILVIREWSVRLGLSAAGLFLAGMAYGLINEGLLAKTIFRASGVPLDLFDHYGFAFGVNWSWALFITVWHGLSSVVFPVTLTHLAFPALAQRPYLGKRTTWALAALAALLSSLFFLNDESSGAKGAPATLAALWAAMALLAFAGSRPRGSARASAPIAAWKPFAAGLAGLPLMFGLLLVVRAAPPVPVYLAAFFAASAVCVWLLRHQGWIDMPAFGRVAHGWYAQMAAFGWIAMIGRSPFTVALGAAILVALNWLCRRAERRAAI